MYIILLRFTAGNVVSYDIASGQGTDKFSIASTTGQITTSGSLSTGQIYSLNVFASDSGSPVDQSV